jgi:membrane associated rhomboid family serine protease
MLRYGCIAAAFAATFSPMAYASYSENQPAVPPVILNLLIANGMLFLLQTLFSGPRGIGMLEQYLALWPVGVGDSMVGERNSLGFYPWQVLTYGFLHGNFMHIFFNMFALWMFGREIELRWGSQRFLFYYLTCVIGAGLIQLIVCTSAFHSSGAIYPTLGASGGTYGILLAFGMLFPYRRIMLLFPPIPMEARYFVILFGGIELFFGVSGLSSGIAHFAHLGGMLFGALLILYWRGKLPIQPKTRMYW